MYSVYILECADMTLYTGVARDTKKRVYAHNHLQCGAKYTRARRPVVLVYEERYESKGIALQREYAIKKLSREEKLALFSFKKRK
jgi:putative endonuclease